MVLETIPSVSSAPGLPLFLGTFGHIKPLLNSEPLKLLFSLPGSQAFQTFKGWGCHLSEGLACFPHSGLPISLFFIFFIYNVDLQYGVSFQCTAE